MSLSGWNVNQKIALTPDYTVVDEDQYNIVVPVRISSSSGKTSLDCSDVFTKLGANKKKIAVEIGDTGEECYVEIEYWDNSGGDALIWCRVPIMLAASATVLNLYYDESHADNDSINSNIKLLVQDAFKDDSSSGHSITKSGSPVIQAFNAGENQLLNDSAYFNGSTSGNISYMTVPNHTSLDLGSGSFTIELLAYFHTIDTSSYRVLIGDWESSGGSDRCWYLTTKVTTGLLQFYSVDSSGTKVADISSDNAVVANKWYHIVIERDSTTFRMYVNGVLQTSTDTSSSTINAGTEDLTIGCIWASGASSPEVGSYKPFPGYLAMVRISDVARYQGTCTVPREISSDSNTNLLIFFDESGWGQGSTPSTFTDSGNIGHTVTNVSQAAVGCTYWWGPALLLDGSSHIYAADNEDWNFGTGNFTLRCKFFLTSVSAHAPLIAQIVDNSYRWQLVWDSAGKISFYAVDGSVIANYEFSFSPVSYRIYDIELVRDGTSIYLFIDGDSKTWTTISTAIGSSAMPDITASLYVGRGRLSSTWWEIDGIIIEPTIYKGEALHTSSFTPSSSPISIGYIGDTQEPQARRVWTEYYKNVLLMAQDPSGGSGCMLDSTSNLNNHTPAGTMTTGDLIDGEIGKAIDFDGTDDSFASDSNLGITGSERRALFIKAKSLTVDDAIIGMGVDSSGNRFDLFVQTPASNGFSLGVSGGSRVFPLDLSDSNYHDFGVVLPDGQDNCDDVLGYGDGSSLTPSSTSAATINTTDASLRIADSIAGSYYNGMDCEVVLVLNIDQPASWFKAMHYAVTDDLLTFEFAAQTAQGDITLPLFLVEGFTGAAGDITLPSLIVSGTAQNLANVGDITLPLFLVEGYTGAAGDITLPLFSVEGFTGAHGNITLPLFLIDATGNVINIYGDCRIPSFIVEGEGHSYPPFVGNIILPSFIVEGFTGAHGNITLPSFIVEGHADNIVIGTGDITLPKFRVEGFAGAHGDITLPSFIVDATARFYGDNIGDITLPLFLVSGSGDSEYIANGNIVLPLFSVSGSAYIINQNIGNIILPSFIVEGSMISIPPAIGDITLPLFEVSGTAKYYRPGGNYGDITLPLFIVEGFSSNDTYIVLRHIRGLTV